jgi:hypothetical protein
MEDRKAKITVISFLIGGIIITLILALRLLKMGRPPSEVVQSAFVLLIFISIPIIAAYRSIRLKQLEHEKPKKRSLLGVRILALFVAALLGALIYYVTYPSVSLAMPLAVLVLAGGLLFFFFVR